MSHFSGQCARDNLRGQKSLGPLKMSLEMAHKVIVPQKKIMSRSFLNSGTLIVIKLWPKILPAGNLCGRQGARASRLMRNSYSAPTTHS
jgi:hypothetical protein